MGINVKGLLGPLVSFAILAGSTSALNAAEQLPESLSWKIRELVTQAREKEDSKILRDGLEVIAGANPTSISEIADYASSQLTGAIGIGSTIKQDLVGAIAAGLITAAPSEATDIVNLVEAKHPQAIAAIFEAVQNSFATAAGTDKQAFAKVPKSVEAKLLKILKQAQETGDASFLETAIRDLIAANPSLALEITTHASEQIGQIASGSNIQAQIASIARGAATAAPQLVSEVTEIIGSKHPEALPMVFESIQSIVASAAGDASNANSSLPAIASTVEPSASASASPSS